MRYNLSSFKTNVGQWLAKIHVHEMPDNGTLDHTSRNEDDFSITFAKFKYI